MAITLPTNATENITGAYSLFKYIHLDASGGWFFIMILLAIFVIIFISLKRYTNATAFVTAAFLNFVFSVILRALGFITNKWMYLSVILVGIGVVWLKAENASSSI